MNLDEAFGTLSERIKDVRRDECMAAHTSFKVGGPADIMVLPSSADEVRHVLNTARQLAVPLFVMGRGTNLLVTSKGIRGIVMKLADNFSGVEFDGTCVTAKSGTPLAVLVREAMERSLGGAEFLGGIPGTLGGAVCMNAGAYGGEIGDFVEEVYIATWAGEVTLSQCEMNFGYRHSILSHTPLIVTGARLKLASCCRDDSKEKLCSLNEKRRAKQPLEYPSAGSTFKRPEGGYAGTMIEQAGLKGVCVGGAAVSEKHAGFVINAGGATPEDIISLIEKVQQRVFEHCGVKLEPEVKIVGER
jgi:UDP-N-acetylmuramate dehydrogenase